MPNFKIPGASVEGKGRSGSSAQDCCNNIGGCCSVLILGVASCNPQVPDRAAVLHW